MMTTILPYTADLNMPIPKTPMDGVYAEGDKEAHAVDVLVTRGGVPVDLTGAIVTGYFIRNKDKATVTMQGSATQDETGHAVVTLDESCYAQTGSFTLTVRILLDGVRHTVFFGYGDLSRTSTDTLVDPENIIPSLDELLAQIEVIERATQEAQTAAARLDNMTVTVTTLPPGSEATAGLTQTQEDAELALGIPAGESGVYIGSGEMPEWARVQIDPEGEPDVFAKAEVETIEGGHRVTVTVGGSPVTFDVMNGAAPERGIDYWTDEDKEEIVQDVINSMPYASGEGVTF